MKIYPTNSSDKKVWNFLIMDTLMRHTDVEHHLLQQEIIDHIKHEYGIEIDRRTISSHIASLNDLFGDVIVKEKGYYFDGADFDEAELRLLIDSVLFSKTLSAHTAQVLIRKLTALGNDYFKPKVSHVSSAAEIQRTGNPSVLYTVNNINDAIDLDKKISFRYQKYGVDFDGKLKLQDRGREYIVSPYQMVASNGKYYLLANTEQFDDVSYYRIDKIRNVTILDEHRRTQKDVKGLENGINLPKHMAENIYMFCGGSIPVQLKTTKSMIDSIVDWFGNDIRIIKISEDSDEVEIKVMCNRNAIHYWALQYGLFVEVQKPESLRQEIKESIEKMQKRYL
ncbi:MAG: WYL domain-containing protein [Lachnospiraceae bacterium]|nr:WYL domain-containing protein [Lachnospiraceae bacterium]